MGCGASTSAKSADAPQQKKDSFGSDLKDFLVKIIKEPGYAKNLAEELKAKEDPENQVEKLLKMLLSIIDTVSSTTKPRHAMPEFITGCLVAFLYHLTMKHQVPEKTVELKALQELNYHVDAKWADAVYDKEKSENPKAELVAQLAKGPNPVTVAEEDIVHFRADSELGKPAYLIALDRKRELILVVVRGTANWKDMITDAAGAAVEWCDGYAHESVAMAAKFIFSDVRSKLLALKQANPTFGVRNVGHSLGGGSAGCLSLLMHRDAEFASAIYGSVPMPGKKSKGSYLITGVGFGSAAVMSKELTEEAHPYFTTVVHDCDLVPRLCTTNVSAFIELADSLVDVFTSIAEDMSKLMKGEKPEGYDFRKVMSMLAKAAKDPGGLLKDMIDEKMDKPKAAASADAQDAEATDAGAQDAEAKDDGAKDAEAKDDGAKDDKRLYSPGRLIFLARPEKGSTYMIAKGSMASPACNLLLKGSMMKDHSATAYCTACCTGEVVLAIEAAPAAAEAPAA